MKLYDVDGSDRPLMLTAEHAELIGATEHEPVSMPAATARKSEWVAFAVASGADPAVADATSKAELIEQYGA
ncbi:hypothetical protein ACFV9C_25370 [Kribbella sp. NPDC059898]|uniref:hypothetical protein n=1 Tax=Kribbella sp. NPDC059898 TaxID=3346995 RepID=UPI00365009A5